MKIMRILPLLIQMLTAHLYSASDLSSERSDPLPCVQTHGSEAPKAENVFQ